MEGDRTTKESALEQWMSHPWVYALGQAPFAQRKIAPFLQHANLERVHSVLDLGCGPGTNAGLFSSAEYVGVDMNGAYIDFARRHYRGEFVTADALSYAPNDGRRFDLILLNSFLHHVDDETVRRLFAHVETLLAADGFVDLIDMVLPEKRCLARTIALLDRGDYPRPLEQWRQLFSERFEVVRCHPYSLGMIGLTLWQAVHLKGKRRI